MLAEAGKQGCALAELETELRQARNAEADARGLAAEFEQQLTAANVLIELAQADVRQSRQNTERYERRMDAIRVQRDALAAAELLRSASVPVQGNWPQTMWSLKAPGDRSVRVYGLADGSLSLSPLTGDAPSPVCLISIPKAGTYLVARLLEQLGVVNTCVHVDRFAFSDYRHKSIGEAIEDYLKFTTRIPIEVSAGLTAPGQFIVGHLEHGAQSAEAVRHMRRILLLRDLRAALVSFMRFLSATGRGLRLSKEWSLLPDGPGKMWEFCTLWGADYLGMVRAVQGWMDDPDVLVCRFEHLMGDAGTQAKSRTLAAIAAHIGMPGREEDLLRRFDSNVLDQPTMTFSGQRTRTALYWDDKVETLFRKLGGIELQQALGYSQDCDP